MRVYDMAKEFGFPSKEFAEIMKSMGIPVKNYMSAVTRQQEIYFRNNFDKEQYLASKNAPKEEKKENKPSTEEKKPEKKPAEKTPVQPKKPAQKTERPAQTRRVRPAVRPQPKKEEEPGVVVVYNTDKKRNQNRPNNRKYDYNPKIETPDSNVKGEKFKNRKKDQQKGKTQGQGQQKPQNNRKNNRKNKKNKREVTPKLIDNAKKTRGRKLSTRRRTEPKEKSDSRKEIR